MCFLIDTSFSGGEVLSYFRQGDRAEFHGPLLPLRVNEEHLALRIWSIALARVSLVELDRDLIEYQHVLGYIAVRQSVTFQCGFQCVRVRIYSYE
jgi:hypothetical protein